MLWADGIRNLGRPSPRETDYAEGVRRTSVAQFEKNGGKVIAAERYASGHDGLQVAVDEAVRRRIADALHVAPQSEFAAGTIIKQARELGLQRTDLWRDDHGGNDRARNRRRRGDRL